MFISQAFAQDIAQEAATAAPPMSSGMGVVGSILPLLLIFAIFYFLVIMPQNKRYKEHQKTVNALAKGDKVILGGGIVGTVRKSGTGREMTVEIADGVTVTVMRSSVLGIYRPEDAVVEDSKAA